jgi:N-acetylneuraminic acid mutarotase
MVTVYDVPYGVLDAILSACGMVDLARVECTCRALKLIASRNELWRTLLLLQVGSFTPLESRHDLSWKQRLQVWVQRDFVWSELGEALCAPRFLHRAATTDNGSYMFGGDSAQLLCFNDVWKVSVHGQQVRVQQCHCSSATSVPAGRSACSICAIGDKLFVFGGLLFFDPVTFSDELWMLDTRTHVWSLLTPKGEAPCGRWGHTMVSWRNKIFLFAGSCPGRTFNDLWYLELDEAPIATPTNVESKDRVFVRWKQIPVQNSPQARGGHASCVIGNRLYVFGGNTLEESFEDLWSLNLENPQVWNRIEAQGQRPNARIGHCAVAIGHHLLIYGGRNFLTQVFCNGVYMYDTRHNQWERFNVRGKSPLERTGHAAIPCAEGVLFFGGLTSLQHATSEVLFLDLFGSEAQVKAETRHKSDLGVFDFGSPRAVYEYGTSPMMGFPNIPTSHSNSSSPVPFSYSEDTFDAILPSPQSPSRRGTLPTSFETGSRRSMRRQTQRPEPRIEPRTANPRQEPRTASNRGDRRSANSRPDVRAPTHRQTVPRYRYPGPDILSRAERVLLIEARERERLERDESQNPSSPTRSWLSSLGGLGGQLLGVLSMFSPKTAARQGFSSGKQLERAALRLSSGEDDVSPPGSMAMQVDDGPFAFGPGEEDMQLRE